MSQHPTSLPMSDYLTKYGPPWWISIRPAGTPCDVCNDGERVVALRDRLNLCFRCLEVAFIYDRPAWTDAMVAGEEAGTHVR